MIKKYHKKLKKHMKRSRSLAVERRARERYFENIERDIRCSIRMITQCICLPSNF